MKGCVVVIAQRLCIVAIFGLVYLWHDHQCCISYVRGIGCSIQIELVLFVLFLESVELLLQNNGLKRCGAQGTYNNCIRCWLLWNMHNKLHKGQNVVQVHHYSQLFINHSIPWQWFIIMLLLSIYYRYQMQSYIVLWEGQVTMFVNILKLNKDQRDAMKYDVGLLPQFLIYICEQFIASLSPLQLGKICNGMWDQWKIQILLVLLQLDPQ